jgi:hypothetical protein
MRNHKSMLASAPTRLAEQERLMRVVARVEGLRGRMSEAGRQVNGLFESLLSEAFSS